MRASLPRLFWRQLEGAIALPVHLLLLLKQGSNWNTAHAPNRVTLYRNARGYKTLVEREVGVATILGIFNTVNESDHIPDYMNASSLTLIRNPQIEWSGELLSVSFRPFGVSSHRCLCECVRLIEN